jgi:casein kinase 1
MATEFRIADKYVLGKKIGSGSFGEIYIATNSQSGEKYAVKLEHRKTKYPQLLFEARLINLLSISKRNIHGLFSNIFFSTRYSTC